MIELEQFDLRFEGREAERIFIAIKLAIGARRRLGISPAVSAFDSTDRFGSAAERGFGQVRGVCITDSFVLHSAQAESLDSVVGRLFEAAIIERQGFGLPILEEQFPVIGAIKSTPDNLAHFATIKSGTVDKRGG